MPQKLGMNLLNLNTLRNNQALRYNSNINTNIIQNYKNTLSLNMLSRLNNSASCGSCGK
jgi:hypothetical protein